MPRVKLLSGLSLDQVSHTPGCPQPCAITQHLGAFFESATQLFELRRQQPRFATCSTGFEERLGALFAPGLVPPTHRLAVNSQFPGHFALAEATVKESSGVESTPFQTSEIAFYAFGIAHAQKLTRGSAYVTILCECQ